MVTQAQIEVLENLSALDAGLKELTDALEKERDANQAKRSQLAALEERLSRGLSGLSEMERTRSELTGELRQMNIQVEKSREKLSRCRTERESNAVQREIEELRKLQRDREVEVQRLEVLIDQARLDNAQSQKERAVIAGELGNEQGTVEGHLEALGGEIQAKNTERETLVVKLPGAIYRRYELVRKRRGSALAWTSEGICSACHMRLQPMLLQKLTRGHELGECPSCNRILYYRPLVRTTAEGDDSA